MHEVREAETGCNARIKHRIHLIVAHIVNGLASAIALRSAVTGTVNYVPGIIGAAVVVNSARIATAVEVIGCAYVLRYEGLARGREHKNYQADQFY